MTAVCIVCGTPSDTQVLVSVFKRSEEARLRPSWVASYPCCRGCDLMAASRLREVQDARRAFAPSTVRVSILETVDEEIARRRRENELVRLRLERQRYLTGETEDMQMLNIRSASRKQ